MPRRSSEKSCAKCGELWAEYDATMRRYIGLIKEQASIAETDVKRSQMIFDHLIDVAEARRNFARSAIEFHRALDHGKKPRTMTAGS